MPEPVQVTPHLLRGWPLPEPGSDKKGRGTVLVVGGSRSTPGAVILAGESALRVGAGTLQVATVESVAGQVSVALPEARVQGFPEGDDGDLAKAGCGEVTTMARNASATLLGPGMLKPEVAAEVLGGIVPDLDGPVVIDALGSAYLTEDHDAVRHLEGACVLTLNPNELAHTLGSSKEDVEGDPVAAATELAARTRAVVLCGGTEKVAVDPGGETYLVHEGGPGLGSSGSGDVQAGIVSGLLARGVEPLQAAVWAAYLHGRAGDRLSGEIGTVGFLARELPPLLPLLLTELGE